MSSLQIDINSIPNVGLRDIFTRIDEATRVFGVEFYLIGARAKDLWLTARNIPPRRFTEDIDFAISMNSMEQFEALRNYLENTGAFIKSPNIPQRIYTADRAFIIDLIPFGKAAIDYHITFMDKDATRMSTLGLKEVFERSATVAISDNLEILTASLPGLVILKLIAWNDRPEVRSKDLSDIAFVIQHYFDLEDELIYEKHNRYFGGELEVDQIGALALGSEMKDILQRSEILYTTVVEILSAHVSQKDASPMIQIMAGAMEMDTDKVTQYIEYIIQGIKEK
jgi:predicted nucleotidyltransferase